MKIPHRGELWRRREDRLKCEVLNVYPDAVTYRYNGSVLATTIEDFTRRYEPPYVRIPKKGEVWPHSNSGSLPAAVLLADDEWVLYTRDGITYHLSFDDFVGSFVAPCSSSQDTAGGS